MVIVDIEAELASIFAMTGAPEFVQIFLLRRKPPISTVGLFANIASPSGEMHTLVIVPAGYDDDEILPPDDRLHFRGAVGDAWRLCEASFKNKKSPSSEEKPCLHDAPIDLDRRSRMLARFQDVYGFAILVFDQPSDRALSLAHHLWMKRSMEFAPLGAVTSYIDQDSPWLLAPKKIAGADLLYAPGASAKKSDVWVKSLPCFPHTAKVMMCSYVIASAQDPDGQQWLNLSAAFAWLDPVDYLVCLGSRSQDPLFARITEAESLARNEWLAEAQRGPLATLSDITHVVSLGFRYPVASEFALKTTQSKANDKRIAFEQKYAPEQLPKGGGERQKGRQERFLRWKPVFWLRPTRSRGCCSSRHSGSGTKAC